MIDCFETLKDCLQKELGSYRNCLSQFLFIIRCRFVGNEQVVKHEILYPLRKYEFYLNRRKNGLFGRLKKNFWHFLFRNRQLKHNIYIEPNSIGCGVNLMHPGFRKIPPNTKIGDNCTLLPMVLIGKKKPGIENVVQIGDNCYISTGVTILGPCRIGNNVVIGAGAVVTKNVSDNTVVVGVPAAPMNER